MALDYLKGKRGNIGNVIWKYEYGNYFRESLDKNNLTKEIQYTSSKSGDGVSGNGGDGVAGNGAKTDKVFLKHLFQIGMLYQNKHQIVFRVMNNNNYATKGATLLASWGNLRIINYIKRKNPNIEIEPLLASKFSIGKLIKDKLLRSKDNIADYSYGCMIDFNALSKNKLIINFYFQEKITLEIDVRVSDLDIFNPLQTIVDNYYHNNRKYTLNLQGLFSVNALELSEIYEPYIIRTQDLKYFSNHPYIKIRRAGKKAIRLLCRYIK